MGTIKRQPGKRWRSWRQRRRPTQRRKGCEPRLQGRCLGIGNWVRNLDRVIGSLPWPARPGAARELADNPCPIYTRPLPIPNAPPVDTRDQCPIYLLLFVMSCCGTGTPAPEGTKGVVRGAAAGGSGLGNPLSLACTARCRQDFGGRSTLLTRLGRPRPHPSLPLEFKEQLGIRIGSWDGAVGTCRSTAATWASRRGGPAIPRTFSGTGGRYRKVSHPGARAPSALRYAWRPGRGGPRSTTGCTTSRPVQPVFDEGLSWGSGGPFRRAPARP